MADMKIVKSGGQRNDWLVVFTEGTERASVEISDIVHDMDEQRITVSTSLRKLWKELNPSLPLTINMELRVLQTIRVLDRWYDGGLILENGDYMLTGDHIISYRAPKRQTGG